MALNISLTRIKMLLIEFRGIVNSGDGIDGMRTAGNDVWI
ncbi:MAG: hypothetical protein ACJA2D_002787 [Pseudohongiellaceae bacterium]|jgi:hypothetical protein